MLHFKNKTHSIEIQPQGSIFIQSLKDGGRTYGFAAIEYISGDKSIKAMHRENIAFLFPKYISRYVDDLFNQNTTKIANIWDYKIL